MFEVFRKRLEVRAQPTTRARSEGLECEDHHRIGEHIRDTATVSARLDELVLQALHFALLGLECIAKVPSVGHEMVDLLAQ